MWICPVCRQGLVADHGNSLVCPSSHRYDVAREGYVNLLLANRRHSQEPGDNKTMIAARRRVHTAGLYQPLAAAIQEQLAQLSDPPSEVLDLGCGEGYYSGTIQQALTTASICGVDIAKPAIKLAARSCPEVGFAVASAFAVPLQDSSQDLVVSVFAPVDQQELLRLLRPGGLYLKITPAPRHLWELRCLLYDQPRPHQPEIAQSEGFESMLKRQLDYTLNIGGDTLRDLIAMTPYAHRGQREKRDKLDQIGNLELQMDFNISLQRSLKDGN